MRLGRNFERTAQSGDLHCHEILHQLAAAFDRVLALHHDVEVAQSATLALSADFVLAAFVVIAVGVTVYDVGKWLAIW